MPSRKPIPLVPVEDLGKPLAHRRFPFRPASAAQVGIARAAEEGREADAAISDALRGVENLLWFKLRQRRPHIATVDGEDVLQRCRLQLTRQALPNFDTWYGVKLSTYLHQCIYRVVASELRAGRRRMKCPLEINFSDADETGGEWEFGICARDESQDDRIALIAEQIIADPERILTKAQAEVLRAILDRPGVQLKDIAASLGYQRASSFSMILRRIRERITAISIQDFPLVENAEGLRAAA